MNAAPHHAFVKAGLRALTRWVRDGVAPPQSPAIEIERSRGRRIRSCATASATRRAASGCREVEAPTATIDGTRNDVAKAAPGAQNFCFLFGQTVPFDRAKLASLYPSHEAFVKKFTAAVDALEKTGYLLAPEAEEAQTGGAGFAYRALRPRRNFRTRSRRIKVLWLLTRSRVLLGSQRLERIDAAARNAGT